LSFVFQVNKVIVVNVNTVIMICVHRVNTVVPAEQAAVIRLTERYGNIVLYKPFCTFVTVSFFLFLSNVSRLVNLSVPNNINGYAF